MLAQINQISSKFRDGKYQLLLIIQMLEAIQLAHIHVHVHVLACMYMHMHMHVYAVLPNI